MLQVRQHIFDARPVFLVHALLYLLLGQPCEVAQVGSLGGDLPSEDMCLEEEDLGEERGKPGE